MMEVRRYQAANQEEWNAFVARSKQGTFLFDRRYMDYHADRFRDASLMIYRDGLLYALLPANAVRENDGQQTLCSHQGLTYGGLVTDEKATAVEVCDVFRAINGHLRSEGFQKVVYKPVPHIYHRIPSEEELYALTCICHAQLRTRNLASVIDLQQPVRWRRDRRYAANKAHTNGIVVEESEELPRFWEILEENLMRRHHATPVHRLCEIQLLQSRFPDNIKLYVGRKADGEILGGTLLYVTPQVIHAQYISASGEGKRLHVLDAIFRHLLTEEHFPARYFDFGTSNEDEGRRLNASLVYQKEGFGGRGVVYDIYEWFVK